MNVYHFAAVACVLAMGSLVRAEDTPDKVKDLPLDDQYIVKALVANNAVIQKAKLVEGRSESEALKAFAKQIIEDHEKVNEKIGDLVKERKLSVVAGLEKEVREEIDRLKELKGAEFDRAYLTSFITGHEKCVRMCKAQVDGGKEEGLKTFAKDCCNKMEEHLKQAKELKEKLTK
jgi:putative membrane protein